jgi:hypothetical protein
MYKRCIVHLKNLVITVKRGSRARTCLGAPQKAELPTIKILYHADRA